MVMQTSSTGRLYRELKQLVRGKFGSGFVFLVAGMTAGCADSSWSTAMLVRDRLVPGMSVRDVWTALDQSVSEPSYWTLHLSGCPGTSNAYDLSTRDAAYVTSEIVNPTSHGATVAERKITHQDVEDALSREPLNRCASLLALIDGEYRIDMTLYASPDYSSDCLKSTRTTS